MGFRFLLFVVAWLFGFLLRLRAGVFWGKVKSGRRKLVCEFWPGSRKNGFIWAVANVPKADAGWFGGRWAAPRKVTWYRIRQVKARGGTVKG